MIYLTRKILSKLNPINKKNAYRLIDVSHFLKLPVLTAIAWGYLIDELKSVSQNRNSAKRIIILSKSAGVDDVIEALSGSPVDAKVDILSRSVIKRSAKVFLKDRVTDVTYSSNDSELEKDKLRYRNHLKKTLKYFTKYFGCDVIIQFSYTYHAERELAAASSEVGIRFITAHKECVKCEPIKKHHISRVKKGLGKYEGYKISVYNEAQKEVVVRSGFADEWQAEVVGCPRLNVSHRKRIIIPDSKARVTILYYLINKTAGLPTYIENGKVKRGVKTNGHVATWKPMVDQVDKTILNFAKINPQIRLLLKTKTGFTKSQLRNFDMTELPENVEVVKEGVGHDLLDQSHIVVGFNSTTVFEAVAAGRITIVPFFENLLDPELIHYTSNKNDGVLVADSKEKFTELLQDSIVNPQLTKKLEASQIKMLDKYLGNGDELADMRFRNFIEEALDTSPEEVKVKTSTKKL